MIRSTTTFNRWAACLAAFACLNCDPAIAQRGQIAPEAAIGWNDKPLATATRHMVAAANPLAAQAGRDILRQGGNAIDAAIATALVLNVVEPQSSGIGGGAFLLLHDAATGKAIAFDGRETAPASARPDRFLVDGKPMPFRQAVNSGLSVGVPGLVRMFEMAHRKHGKLPWAELFNSAITLARDGFPVSARLNGLLAWYGAARFAPQARAHYFDAAGAPRPVGYILKNPQLSATFEAVARGGANAFYEGEVADAIVAAVANAANAKGDITRTDLSTYTAIERAPVCITYRERQICGMGPPSSGGLTVAQTLKLIEPFEVIANPKSRMGPTALHLIAEAEKLAYADRDFYIADPAFIEVPNGLLDDAYLAERRGLIALNKAMVKPAHGKPPGSRADLQGKDATRERAGTTHVSIMDRDGNAVSMTATIEGAFGSGLWAAGFLLNNELTDFSLKPVDAEDRVIANRIEGGKRPRSSMAPTIVYAPGRGTREVEVVLGAPGGHRIILYVVKALVAMLDWDLDPQAAAALANFGDRGRGFEIEAGPGAAAIALRLGALGHRVRTDRMTSGLHIVARRNSRLEGGADPRREGVAIGD